MAGVIILTALLTVVILASLVFENAGHDWVAWAFRRSADARFSLWQRVLQLFWLSFGIVTGGYLAYMIATRYLLFKVATIITGRPAYMRHTDSGGLPAPGRVPDHRSTPVSRLNCSETTR